MTTLPHSLITSWHGGTEEVCLELRCRRSNIVEKGVWPTETEQIVEEFLNIFALDKLEPQEAPREAPQERARDKQNIALE